MASAYSDDLRRKFYEAYQRGDGSLAVLASRFGVSLGWAEKLLRAVRQNGQVERPVGRRRGPVSKLTPKLRERLRGWIQTQPDLTLAELQLRLWEHYELEVSLSRVWTVLGEMGLYLKKSPSMPPNKILRQPASRAASGGRKSARSKRRS